MNEPPRSRPFHKSSQLSRTTSRVRGAGDSSFFPLDSSQCETKVFQHRLFFGGVLKEALCDPSKYKVRLSR